eukprot:Clim_evm18s78 gene=Clim_evmTU18s78
MTSEVSRQSHSGSEDVYVSQEGQKRSRDSVGTRRQASSDSQVSRRLTRDAYTRREQRESKRSRRHKDRDEYDGTHSSSRRKREHSDEDYDRDKYHRRQPRTDDDEEHTYQRIGSSRRDRSRERAYRHRKDRAHRHRRHGDNRRRESGKELDRNEQRGDKELEGPKFTKRPPTVYIPPHLRKATASSGVTTAHGSASEAKRALDQSMQRRHWNESVSVMRGLLNRLTDANIREIAVDMIDEVNVVRLRGILCQLLLKTQRQSTKLLPAMSALVAVLNSLLPRVGLLLFHRLLAIFQEGIREGDRLQTLRAASFLSHLVTHKVVHEMIILELLFVLLDTGCASHEADDIMYTEATADLMEVCVTILQVSGHTLQETVPKGLDAIFEQLREQLSHIDDRIHRKSQMKRDEEASDFERIRRMKYTVEAIFEWRKKGFTKSENIIDILDILPEEDCVTHEHSLLNDEGEETITNPHWELDQFQYDPNFRENEKKYEQFRMEVLEDLGPGDTIAEEEEAVDDDGQGADALMVSESLKRAKEHAEELKKQGALTGSVSIVDHTDTNVVNFRKTVYLTLNTALSADDATHKLLQLILPEGYDALLVKVVLECCVAERTYRKFYGVIAERLMRVNRHWTERMEELFRSEYANLHNYDTTILRNTAFFFAHVFEISQDLNVASTMAPLPSEPLEEMFHLRITQEDTTSGSRIFLKYLFQELFDAWGLDRFMEEFGLDQPQSRGESALDEATNDQDWTEIKQKLRWKGSRWSGGRPLPLQVRRELQRRRLGRQLIPYDGLTELRFAINFFTSINLGPVTDDAREELTAWTEDHNAEMTRQAMAEGDRWDDDDAHRNSGRSRSYSSERSDY